MAVKRDETGAKADEGLLVRRCIAMNLFIYLSDSDGDFGHD
jgi:hypothetical protein